MEKKIKPKQFCKRLQGEHEFEEIERNEVIEFRCTACGHREYHEPQEEEAEVE